MHSELTNHWKKYLVLIDDKDKDIYFTEEYVNLYASKEDSPNCAVCTEGDKVYLVPFLERKISEFKDFETAYGYGGPITNSDDREWIGKAAKEVDNLLAANGYICGFQRLHPFIPTKDHLSDGTKILFDRETVYIDTLVSEEDIWNDQISSKNRNMIRKAEKNGLVYKAEYDFESLEEFKELYKATMTRLDAERFYFFDDEYFKRFKDSFKGSSFLGTVRKDDKLICAAIFMYSKKYGHYHLEGSDSDFSGYGANNLLLWKTACEMNNLGIEKFHLGGGYDTSPDNSLLKFKKAFSKNTLEFFIGKCIFNKKEYDRICNEWELKNPEKVALFGNRLLKYRY